MGEREAGVVGGVLLVHQGRGGPGSAEERGGRHGGHGARDGPVATVTGSLYKKKTDALFFFLFLLLIKKSSIFYLIEAFKQFYKFCQNSLTWVT